jgi:hypothetical protein
MSAIRLLHVVLVAIFVLVAGCGSSVGGFSGGESSGGGGGSGSSGGSGSGGTNGGSNGGSGGSSGGVSVSADGGSRTVTLTMGPFTVPAGTEVFKCQNFANPFGGQDTDIDEYEEQMTEGSHHMFLFFASGATDGPVQDCSAGGLTFGPYPFGAQTPTASLQYPAGVGSRIPGSMGFMMNAHFVNVSATPFQATLTVTMHVAAPGSVKQYAGVVFMNNISLVIPPTNTPYDATATCVLPQDMYVLQSTAHMHMRGDSFVAKTATETLYSTQSWSSPVPANYTPPMQLKAGTAVTWTCTYTNDTGAPLTFGESAEINVMCIYMMQFFPLADPSNPTIQCHT